MEIRGHVRIDQTEFSAPTVHLKPTTTGHLSTEQKPLHRLEIIFIQLNKNVTIYTKNNELHVMNQPYASN